VAFAMRDRVGLADLVAIDQIAGDQILGLDRAAIHHRQRPALDRGSDRPPQVTIANLRSRRAAASSGGR